ncbi:MAG: hypothetical protein IJF84_03835 [Thermoguttaceae bacterium]|nr:hypothetical protein [Thermoguttaceae bacterium]
MAKRKTKSDSKTVSNKSGAEKKAPKKPESNSNLNENKGSLSRFLEFFIPGVGFGGAFLLISALVMGVLYWFNESYYPANNSDSWKVEYNLPQGVWKNADILEFVQKSHPGLFEKKFDDNALLQDVSISFSLSPIVKKVNSVQRRFPNTVVLDIEYFEPIAMVYVESGNNNAAFFPVDKDGYQLPSTYFKESEKNKYLAITGIASLPMNPVGQSWNDVRVETACKIALELTPYKDELGIVGIYVHDSKHDKRLDYTPICFDIWLKNQTFIRWSRYIFVENAPQLVDKELTTKEKIALLRQYMKEKGDIKPDSSGDMFRFIPNSESEPESNPETKTE